MHQVTDPGVPHGSLGLVDIVRIFGRHVVGIVAVGGALVLRVACGEHEYSTQKHNGESNDLFHFSSFLNQTAKIRFYWIACEFFCLTKNVFLPFCLSMVKNENQ
jgi:hypothetical protein